jgi:predicted transcriptional regulator
MYVQACLQNDEVIVHPFSSISSIEDLLLDKSYVVIKDDSKFYGVLTPSDVIMTGHQLAIDCLRPKTNISEKDDISEVLALMNNEKQYVLPVFSEKKSYIGSVTYKRIIEEVGLLKKQPAEIKITNIVGDHDTESVKQSFIHELYHNTKNPVQVIYSSINLIKHAKSDIEKECLFETILESTRQVDDTISELFFTYFKIS